MTAQHTQNLPLALDLANWLESVSTGLSANQAAAELRRLHAASERLAALEAALAEPAQEPVAWVDGRWYEDGTRAGNTLVWAGRRAEDDFPVGTKLYTHPATPLSEEQIHNADPAPHIMSDAHRIEFARAIEQAHGIGVEK